MSKLTTTAKNPGAAVKIITQLQILAGREIAQGWLESAPDKTAATIAAYNIFGTPTIPPRDALAPSMEQTTPTVQRAAIAAGQSAGRGSLDQSGLESAAQDGARNLKQAVRDFSSPGNAESTIATKGFDNALIGKGDGGRILNSAGAELRDRSP